MSDEVLKSIQKESEKECTVRKSVVLEGVWKKGK